MNGIKIRQLIGRAAIAGGLITGGVSLLDGIANSLSGSDTKARIQIMQELEGEYGVTRKCVEISGGFPATYCYDHVQGDHTQEEIDQILTQFNAESNQRIDEIPVDEETRARGTRDSLGLVGGLGLAAVGSRLNGSNKERG